MIKDIKRLFYQAGMALGEKELAAEQDYHTLHRRLHNFYMHGWGIVAGLDVIRTVDPLKNTYSVTVTPGMALFRDSSAVINGNLEVSREIVLTEPRTINLDRYRPVADTYVVYVYAAYHEEQDTPAAGDLTSNAGVLNTNATKNIYTYEQPGFFVSAEKPSNSGENLILASVELTMTAVGAISYDDALFNPLRRPASGVSQASDSIKTGDLNTNQPGSLLNRLKTALSGGANWPDLDGDGKVDIKFIVQTLLNKLKADVIPYDMTSSVSDRLNVLGMSARLTDIVKGIYDGDKITRLEMIQALTRADVVGNMPIINDLINLALTGFSVVTVFAETETTPFVPAGSLGEGMDIKLGQFFRTEGAGAYQWQVMRKTEDLMHLFMKTLSDFLLSKGISGEMIGKVSDFETPQYSNHPAVRFYFLAYIYNPLMGALGAEKGVFDFKKIQTLVYEFIEYFFVKYHEHLRTSNGELFCKNMTDLDVNMSLLANFGAMIGSVNMKGLCRRLGTNGFTDNYPVFRNGQGKIFYQSDASGEYFWLRTQPGILQRFSLAGVEEQLSFKDKLPAAYADYVSPPTWAGHDMELVITGEEVVAAFGSQSKLIWFTKIPASMQNSPEYYKVYTVVYEGLSEILAANPGVTSIPIDLQKPPAGVSLQMIALPQGVVPVMMTGALNPQPWVYMMSNNPDYRPGLCNLDALARDTLTPNDVLNDTFMTANTQVYTASSGITTTGALEKDNRVIFVTRRPEGVLISVAVFGEGLRWYTDVKNAQPAIHHFLLQTGHIEFVDIVNDQALVNLRYPFNSHRGFSCFTFLSLKALVNSTDGAWGKDGVGTFVLRVEINTDGNIVYANPPAPVTTWESVFSMNEIMLHRSHAWNPVYDTQYRKAFVRTNRGIVVYDFNSKEKFPATKAILPNNGNAESFVALSKGTKSYVCYYKQEPGVVAEFVDYVT